MTSGDISTVTDCPDPFHTGDGDGERFAMEMPPGDHGWSGYAYRCPTCGFQTATIETYIPVVKPCAKCGKDFEGMPDVADETCDECFEEGLPAMIQRGAVTEP